MAVRLPFGNQGAERLVAGPMHAFRGAEQSVTSGRALALLWVDLHLCVFCALLRQNSFGSSEE